MLYKIKNSTENNHSLPKFLWIDSLPIRDNDSNIYNESLIYHISQNDYSMFHRKDYPECFRETIASRFCVEKSSFSFIKSSYVELEKFLNRS